MVNQNDERILLLQKQVDEKEQKLNSFKRIPSNTNCSLLLEGEKERYNLNVISKEQVISLLIRLNSLRLSANNLGLLNQYEVSGYKIEDWMHDLKVRLSVIEHNEEMVKLKELKNKLSTLLSNDKKIELELESIEEMLK